jgi:hypothetical protein
MWERSAAGAWSLGALPAQEQMFPTCAIFAGVFEQFHTGANSGGSLLQISAEEMLVSGASTQTVFDCADPLLGIELLLVSVRITPGALRAMTPRQLTRALQHPLRDVREAVLLGLGQ